MPSYVHLVCVCNGDSIAGLAMQHFDGCKQFPEVLSDFGQYLMSNDQTEAACVVYEVCILNITLRKPCRRRQKKSIASTIARVLRIYTYYVYYIRTYVLYDVKRSILKEGRERKGEEKSVGTQQ